MVVLRIMLLLLFTCQAAIAQIPTSGLVAHWSFNGNANDVSGNGHHGNTNNVTLVAGKSGIPNTAYLFNNVNSFIGVPYSSTFNVNAISMCAYIKPTAFYTGNCQGNFILSRGTQGTSGSLILDYFDNAYNSCAIADTNNFVFAGQVGPVILPATTMQNATKVHTNNWYCFILTFDGTTGKIYIDGSLINSFTGWSSTIGSSTDSICIGKYPWGGAAYPYNFIGAIDDIALYNKALTPAEVSAYCNAVAPPDTIVYISQPLNKTSFCPGDTVHVNYQVTLPFNSGNVFTAQLANGTGSFVSPVSIGSLASTTDGKIICTIPSNTPAGTGYRIRIVASSPVKTSADNGINLSVSPKPIPALSSNSPVCEKDTIKLTANYTGGGASYSWTGPGSFTSTGSTTARPNAAVNMSGTYTVITSTAGCKDTSTISVSVNPTPVVTILGNSSVCIGDSIKLTANTVPAGISCVWSGPAGFNATGNSVIVPAASSIQSGKYIVTATSANSCIGKDTADVVATKVEVSLGKDTTICSGSWKLTPNVLGASYLWQDGSTAPSLTVNTSGKYYVTITLNSCKASDTVNVDLINISMSLGRDTSLCPGAEYILSVPDTFDVYNWSTGSHTNTSIANKAGKYWLGVGKKTCFSNDTIVIGYYNPSFDIGNDTILCKGQTLNLRAESIPGSVYSWQDGSSNPSHIVYEPNLFWVRATNQCGIYSDSISVGYEECDCRPIVPTVFSPNNDGLNDRVSPIVFCPVKDYKFVIANRWGNIVFQSANPSEKWDGFYKGVESDQSTYFYYFEVTGEKGSKYVLKGNITLVR